MRPARCNWRVAGLVGVHANEGQSAHFSGLERCGSIWACPCCAAVIRNHRAVEIQAGADRWVQRGGSVLMMTPTLRHRRSDGLRESLGLLQRAYTRLMNSRGWKALMKRHGYAGQIRAVESPWGTENGWHPHAHTLLFMGQMTDDEIAAVEREAFDLWQLALTKEGGRSVLRGRGLVVTRGAAAYVAKVQEHDGPEWLAGSELARGDLKRGRGKSFMPFELLDLQGEAARALWLEYVEVTRGRQAMIWSRGLRDLLGVDALTDDEVIEQTEAAALVFLLDGPEYDGIRNDPEALVSVLEEAEAMVSGGDADDGRESGGLEPRGSAGAPEGSGVVALGAGAHGAERRAPAPGPRHRLTGDLGRPEG